MKAVQSIKLDGTGTTSYSWRNSYTTSAISNDTERYIYLPIEEDNLRLDETGKYSVYDVANWFLSKAEMTHKKLQKLCYYAQAWCYALRGYRLVDTDFQAWVHGPVSPALWERFKGFGYDPIRIKGNIKNVIAPEDIELLEDVWETYGEETGNSLETLTHREEPWIEARRGYEPDEKCTVVISPETMAKYYKSIYSGD